MNDFTKEQMLAAYRTLPEPIQDAFNDPQNNAVMTDLQKQHQLHIDVAGVVNVETGYLLLGLISPSQYADRLRTRANIPADIVSSVVKEVNDKIFMPLQKKMKEGGGASSKPPPMPPTPPPAPSTPSALRPPSASVPSYQSQTPPIAPQSKPLIPPIPPKPPAPPAMRAMPNTLKSVPGYGGPTPPQPPPRSAGGPPPNLPGAMPRLLSDHEVSHINVGQESKSAAPQPQGAVQRPAWQSPRPVQAGPPSAPTPPFVSRPASPPAPPKPPPPPYGADPYREPVDLG